MNRAVNYQHNESVAKKIVATVMMLLLLLVTSINFVYLSNDAGTLISCLNANGDEDTGSDCANSPAGPDEKSPNAPVAVTEEFLHVYHNAVNPDWVNMFFQHKVHEAEKLCIFHPESFSPPPEA